MKEGKNRVLAEVWGWVWRLALAVVIAQAVHLMAVSYTHLDVYKRQSRSNT